MKETQKWDYGELIRTASMVIMMLGIVIVTAREFWQEAYATRHKFGNATVYCTATTQLLTLSEVNNYPHLKYLLYDPTRQRAALSTKGGLASRAGDVLEEPPLGLVYLCTDPAGGQFLTVAGEHELGETVFRCLQGKELIPTYVLTTAAEMQEYSDFTSQYRNIGRSSERWALVFIIISCAVFCLSIFMDKQSEARIALSC